MGTLTAVEEVEIDLDRFAIAPDPDREPALDPDGLTQAVVQGALNALLGR